MAMRRNESDENSRNHWRFVADVSRNVDTWPVWKRRGLEEGSSRASDSERNVRCTTERVETDDRHE